MMQKKINQSYKNKLKTFGKKLAKSTSFLIAILPIISAQNLSFSSSFIHQNNYSVSRHSETNTISHKTDSDLFVSKVALPTVDQSYLPADLSDGAIENKIASILAIVHDNAKKAFDKVNSIYPKNQNQKSAKDMLFILRNITDPSFNKLMYESNQTFYQKLVENILNIIKYNITNLNFWFFKDGSKQKMELENEKIPFLPLDSDLISSKSTQLFVGGVTKVYWNNSYGTQISSDTGYMVNNLNEQQKIQLVGYFISKLNSLSDLKFTSLDDFNTTTYPNWFDHVPDNQRPKRNFNNSLTQSEYLNFVNQISSSDNQNFLNQVYALTSIQTSYAKKIIDEKNLYDHKILEKITTDKTMPLLIDLSPNKIANLLAPNQPSDFLNQLNAKWNLRFSKHASITINPSIVEKYPDIDFKAFTFNVDNNGDNCGGRCLNNKQIKISSGTNNKSTPELNKYFAVISKQNANFFGNADSYKLDSKGSVNDAFNFLSNEIKTQIVTDANKWISLKLDVVSRFQQALDNFRLFELTANDFVQTNLPKELFEWINLTLQFKPKSISKDNVWDYLSNKIPLDVSLKINFANPYSSLSRHNDSMTIQFETKFSLEGIIDLKEFLKKLVTVPPIYRNPDPTKEPHIQEIISAVNNQTTTNIKQPYFFYETVLADKINYSAVKARIIDDENMEIITEISDKNNSNLKSQYPSIIPLSVFVNDQAFQEGAKKKSAEINQRVKTIVGDKLYDPIIKFIEERKIFDKAINETKADASFSEISLEEQINLFGENYEKNLSFFLNQFAANNPEYIKNLDNYYHSLEEKFEALTKQQNLNPNDSFLKESKKLLEEGLEQLKNGNFDLSKLNNENKLSDLMSILNETNQNKMIEKFKNLLAYINPKKILQNIQSAQKGILGVITAITGTAMVAASFFVYRTWRINGSKYKLSKRTLMGIAGSIAMIALVGFVFLAIMLAGVI